MKDHLSGSTEFHLNSLYDLVCAQKKQLENQRERIQLQKEHIQLQKESLLLQSQEIADVRSRTANGELIWRITDFTRKLMDAKSGRAPEPMISEPFFTHPNGYKMCAGLWLNGIGTGRGRYISVGLQVSRAFCVCIFARAFCFRSISPEARAVVLCMIVEAPSISGSSGRVRLHPKMANIPKVHLYFTGSTRPVQRPQRHQCTI